MHRFELPGSKTHEGNTVKTQSTPLNYGSKLDHELQLSSNRALLRVDVNTGLWSAVCETRSTDLPQSAPLKRDTTNIFNYFTVIQCRNFYWENVQ